MKSIITNIKSIFTWDDINNSFLEINNKNILIENGIIIELCDNIPSVDEEIDADGLCITPGFIDSHTHPVFANNRANEFKMRVLGKSYKEITEKGGGIISSINAVRKSTEDELYNFTLENIETLFSHGSTLIEAKSGYGLTLEDEIKSLKVLSSILKSTSLNSETLCAQDPFENQNDLSSEKLCSLLSIFSPLKIPTIKYQ